MWTLSSEEEVLKWVLLKRLTRTGDASSKEAAQSDPADVWGP